MHERGLQFFVHFFAVLYKETTWHEHMQRILENVKYDGRCLNFFSNFDVVLQIQFEIPLTVIDKLSESNSCEKFLG